MYCYIFFLFIYICFNIVKYLDYRKYRFMLNFYLRLFFKGIVVSRVGDLSLILFRGGRCNDI